VFGRYEWALLVGSSPLFCTTTLNLITNVDDQTTADCGFRKELSVEHVEEIIEVRPETMRSVQYDRRAGPLFPALTTGGTVETKAVYARPRVDALAWFELFFGSSRLGFILSSVRFTCA
jgi:hypothetical protein